MENIFKTVKKQYLSDVELAFDFASELLDKLYEKYPNATLEFKNWSRGIDLVFIMNETMEVRISYVPAMCSTSAPGLIITLEALGPREQMCSVYTKGTPMNLPRSIQYITEISMDKYNKTINIYDKNENYPAFESEVRSLLEMVTAIDFKLDKDGNKFKTITSTDRAKFDDYIE